jgi:ribosome-binding protein aMBF1 (putative translation factor)
MAKIKSSKNVESFSKEILGLDDYDNWLITTKNKIIASIVKARKKDSVSQKDLAEMLNTTQSVISRIENGTSKSITLDYLMKVASVLGISSNVTLKKAA